MIVLTALLFSPFIQAQEPSKFFDKKISAVRVDSPPIIDGVLDDEAWKGAPTHSDLHQVRPYEYEDPNYSTEFSVIYDKDALYIGITAYDDEPEKIVANVLKQEERISEEDHVTVILDAFNNQRSGYMFLLNTNSVRWDGKFVGPREFSPEWDGIWEGKVSVDDDRYTAEFMIPFKSLSFYPDTETWGINIARVVQRNREWLVWNSRDRIFTPAVSGQISGLRDIDLGRGWEVVPSISLGKSNNFDGTGTQYNFEPSINAFYQITPALNGSFTVNTDFSATEVDDRQVNLSRFNLFFPEKRDFFLKDVEIFEFGYIGGSDSFSLLNRVERENARPYFSRKIGLSQTGEPVDLNVGGKLTGRLDQWNFGAQAIHQGSFENVDATEIFVGRVSRNILENSSIGAILTYGDPTSNDDNLLAGVDLRYRSTTLIPDNIIEGYAWYQQTDTDGVSGDDSAWSVGMLLRNDTKLHGRLEARQVQKNFNPALGFVNRLGINQYTAGLGYIHIFKHPYFRKATFDIEASHFDRIDGGLQSQAIRVRPLKIENHDGDTLDLRFSINKEGLIDNFEISDGVIITPGLYTFSRFGVFLTSSPQRKLSGGLTYVYGQDYDGTRKTYEGKINYRPSKHFNIGGSYQLSNYDTPFGDFISRLITFKNDIVFSETLSWSNLVQFDNVSNIMGINSRLHWIPKAGKELFFVINHNFLDDPMDGFRSDDSDITLKLNYTYRF
jgi:hypothetical protein